MKKGRTFLNVIHLAVIGAVVFFLLPACASESNGEWRDGFDEEGGDGLDVDDAGDPADVSCPAGTTLCDGNCVDTSTNHSNCGSCGHTCNDAQVCRSGECILECPPGEDDCSVICTDLDSDHDNCGSCGHACGTDEVCSNGMCTSECAAGLTNCSGSCVDLQTSRSHCGSCGQACAGDEVCDGGHCQGGCGNGLCSSSAGETSCICPEDCGFCSGCCDPSHLCLSGITSSACGTGGEQCDVCVAGETCTSGDCVTTTTCGPGNCGGCCSGNVCESGTSTSACGTGGETCQTCGGGQSCSGGDCVTTCGPGNCGGCCSGNVCQSGTSTSACGTGGETCQTCGGGQSCSGGDCVCDSHDHKECYDNDVYWYDACGNREDKYQDCGAAGCSGAVCQFLPGPCSIAINVQCGVNPGWPATYTIIVSNADPGYVNFSAPDLGPLDNFCVTQVGPLNTSASSGTITASYRLGSCAATYYVPTNTCSNSRPYSCP
jgi:hypothetical protein